MKLAPRAISVRAVTRAAETAAALPIHAGPNGNANDPANTPGNHHSSVPQQRAPDPQSPPHSPLPNPVPSPALPPARLVQNPFPPPTSQTQTAAPTTGTTRRPSPIQPQMCRAANESLD